MCAYQHGASSSVVHHGGKGTSESGNGNERSNVGQDNVEVIGPRHPEEAVAVARGLGEHGAEGLDGGGVPRADVGLQHPGEREVTWSKEAAGG